MNPFDLTFIGIYSCSNFMRNLNTVDLRKYPHLIYDWLWSSYFSCNIMERYGVAISTININWIKETILLGIPMQFKKRIPKFF